MFSKEGRRRYREENICPNTDQVCRKIAMFGGSGRLLATWLDTDDIAGAILKVYENRDKLSSA